jgi:hypothetical protein
VRDGFTPSKNKGNPIGTKMEMSAYVLLQAKWFGDYFGQELRDSLMALKKAIEETMDLSFAEGLYFAFSFSVERAVEVCDEAVRDASRALETLRGMKPMRQDG